jgi:hypothetical protein
VTNLKINNVYNIRYFSTKFNCKNNNNNIYLTAIGSSPGGSGKEGKVNMETN